MKLRLKKPKLQLATYGNQRGATDEKAKANLKDSDLLNQFKAVDAMTEKDKNVIKLLIDAFITKQQIKKLAI